jgi:SAM-dependent methyltransferase
MNPDAADTLRETFDYAICNLVIEHVPDPQLLLDQIAKFLKPGGRGYLLAPLMWGQHQIPHDYFRFTSFGLDLLLRRAGFAEIHIAPIGGFFYFLALQLQLSVLLLFPDRMAWWLKLILAPVKLLAYCVLGVALPFLVR